MAVAALFLLYLPVHPDGAFLLEVLHLPRRSAGMTGRVETGSALERRLRGRAELRRGLVGRARADREDLGRGGHDASRATTRTETEDAAIPQLKSPEDVERFLVENEGPRRQPAGPPALTRTRTGRTSRSRRSPRTSASRYRGRARTGSRALQIPMPADRGGEARQLVAKFLEGLRKLLTKENNWTFLQPLMLSLENCVKCQTCAESCPIYTDSGRGRRSTGRPSAPRSCARSSTATSSRAATCFPKLRGNDIELTWDTIVHLAELSYRCTLCRRCAQACPVGVDNAPDHPRDPQAVQPGAGHPDARAAREGHGQAAQDRLLHRA